MIKVRVGCTETGYQFRITHAGALEKLGREFHGDCNCFVFIFSRALRVRKKLLRGNVNKQNALPLAVVHVAQEMECHFWKRNHFGFYSMEMKVFFTPDNNMCFFSSKTFQICLSRWPCHELIESYIIFVKKYRCFKSEKHTCYTPNGLLCPYKNSYK